MRRSSSRRSLIALPLILPCSLPHLFSILLLFAGTLVSGPRTARAQEGAVLTGYFEHQYSLARHDGAWSHLDYDRLRADVDVTAGRSTRASAAVVWQIYRGNTSIRLRDLLPERYKALAPTFPIPIEDQHFLNHAYVVLRPGPFTITAGKQYLAWGRGMVFNPTELFRPKNLLEPTYEREGVGAVQASLPTGPLGDISLVYVPDGGPRSSAKALRLRHHISGWDLSALVAELHESTSLDFMGRPVGGTERRLVLGGDVTGEVLGFGLWGEATYNRHAGSTWWEATVGGNTTLPWGTLLAVEGYYDGRGQWDEPYSLTTWLSRLTGTRRTLGKGMLFATLSHPAWQLWTFSVSGLANTGDRSLVLIPTVLYSFAQNVDLTLYGYLSAGDEGTEFGSQGQGGFIRARVYF